MKRGIDYFPLDVDFFDDDKIMLISSKFGIKGELVTIRLLARIYKTNGYYLSWNEDTARLFAKAVGLGEEAYCLVSDIVHELARRGFFNEEILGSFGVLTSHGIQVRYLKAVERRKTVEMIEEYCLVHPENFKNIGMIPLCAQNSAKCLHDVYISGENVNISGKNVPYSKGEYKKEYKKTTSSSAEREETMTTTTTEKSFKKKDLFEQCQEMLGGSIPSIKAILVPYLRVMEEALIMRAVTKAVLAEKPSWGYARKVLQQWVREGILTLEDQDQDQRRFNEKKYPEKPEMKVQEFSDIYVPRASVEEREGSDEK